MKFPGWLRHWCRGSLFLTAHFPFFRHLRKKILPDLLELMKDQVRKIYIYLASETRARFCLIIGFSCRDLIFSLAGQDLKSQ